MAVSLGITITQNSQNVANNTSNVSVSVYCWWSSGSYNKNSPGPAGWLKIDGVEYSFRNTFNDNRTSSGTKTLFTKTLDVVHDIEGKKTIYCSASFTTGVSSGTITASASKALTDIPRFAILESAPNFNDEEKPTITYSNPAGANVTSLQACITLDGSDPNVDASVAVTYKDLPVNGTSYTFNDITSDELYSIQYATTGSNSRKVWFKIKTEIGGNIGYSQLERTFTIANPNPVINPVITDTNATTVALTGDSSKLVRYYSNARIAIAAYAVKAATITEQRVTCGGVTLTADGTINGVTTNNFVFTAKDNRGNTTTKTVTPSLVNYIKPTCIIDNNIPDTDGKMIVQASGNYFNGSFGAQNNALKVYYRYKEANASWTDDNAWTLMSVTLGNNTYFATANVTGLDYQTAYTFQTYASDALVTTAISEKTVKATPIFDWGENDFKFNVPVYDEFATMIRNGKAAYTGIGTNAIDPNTTVEELCLTDHANGPRQGYWFFIRTMFYGDPSESVYRTQIAFPSSTGVSTYYRTYSSDSGWASWRRYVNEDENQIAYTGAGADAVDPNTTTAEICFTDHANTPLQGYWFFIRTVIYGDKETSPYRTQIAVLSGGKGSMYHRHYTSAAGWSAWRRHLNEDENYTQMKLLWENASPTSAFPQQSVPLDLSEYELVYINFLTHCSSGSYRWHHVSTISAIGNYHKVIGYSETGSDMGFRGFLTSENDIYFYPSYYASTYSANTLSSSNNMYVPLRIYGIKGVIK